MDPDCSKGKIYEMVIDGLCYIGSTIQPLSARKAQHKSRHKQYKSGKTTKRYDSFVLFDIGEPEIKLLEKYPCDSLAKLRKREGRWQRKYECVNDQIAGRTPPEYYQDNKERMDTKNKEYYKKHKEAILAYSKQYNANNREKIDKKNQEYRDNNKEKIRARNATWRKNNKEMIREKGNVRLLGGTFHTIVMSFPS